MSDATTVIETVAGLFERKNLTLNDPPLMSINCTSNCGERMLLSYGNLNISVSYRLYLCHVYTVGGYTEINNTTQLKST